MKPSKLGTPRKNGGDSDSAPESPSSLRSSDPPMLGSLRRSQGMASYSGPRRENSAPTSARRESISVAPSATSSSSSATANRMVMEYSFSDYSVGQDLPDPDDSSKQATRALRFVFDIDDEMKQIAGGGRHQAILTTLGLVFTWGSGKSGQLGNCSLTDLASPTLVDEIYNEKIIQIACGGAQMAAISERGEVWYWGWNGLKPEDPVPSRIPIGGAVSVIKVALGAFHGLLMVITQPNSPEFYNMSYRSLLTELEPSIEVWSWGSGSSGQLGLDHLAAVIQSPNSLLASSAKQIEPRRINSLNDKYIVDIIADDVTSAAISRDGKVYLWGQNNFELQTVCSTLSIPAPILIDFVPIESDETTPFSSRIQKIVFGRRWGMALSQDGKIYTWGQNSGGQLGLGDLETRHVPTMIPTEFFNLDPMQETIVNIACRNRQAFAWTSKMTVFTWGTFGPDSLTKPKLLRFSRHVLNKVALHNLEIRDIVLASNEVMVLLKKPNKPNKDKNPKLQEMAKINRLSAESLSTDDTDEDISETTEGEEEENIDGYGEQMESQHIEQMIANIRKSQPNTSLEFSERVLQSMKLFLELCEAEQEAVRLLIKEHDSEAELNLTTDIEFTLLSKCNGKLPSYSIPSDRFAIMPSPVTVSQWKPLVIDDISFSSGFDWASLGTRSYQSSLIANLKNGGNFLFYYRSKDRGREFKEANVWLSSDGRQIIYMENQVAHKGSKKSIDLYEIKEIRLGQKTQPFERRPPQPRDDAVNRLSFSLVARPGKTYDFVAKSYEMWEKWVRGLIILIAKWRSTCVKDFVLQTYWAMASTQMLNFSLLRKLLMSMNLSKANCDKFIQYAHVSENISLPYYDFCTLINTKLWVHSHLFEVYKKYCDDDGCMNDNGFAKFLQNEQSEKHNMEAIQELLSDFRPPNHSENNMVSFHTFHQYITSARNHAIDPIPTNFVYNDMAMPLTDYFIKSSHNTYCENDQFFGISTCDMYRRVLLEGCRCVELDTWDGDNGEPVIYHGRTLTTKIYLEDVCQVIRDYAFVTSPYPIILSIENHCGLEQQARIAEIFVNIFQDMIFSTPDTDEADPNLLMPSPMDLIRRILIKGSSKLPQLSKLFFMRSTPYSKLKSSSSDQFGVCSFTENAVKKKHSELLPLSKRAFLRVYPAGDRVSSSNYNPERSWRAGFQMVALNLQTVDLSTLKNNLKFSDNGGCGYILKPPRMLSAVTESLDTAPRVLNVTVVSARNLPGRDKGAISPAVCVNVSSLHKSECSGYYTRTIRKNGASPKWKSTFSLSIRDFGHALLLFIVFDMDSSQSSSDSAVGKAMGSIALPALGLANSVSSKNSGSAGSKTKVAMGGIPLACLRLGYRTIPLLDINTGEVIPMCDLLCHFAN